MTFADKRPCPLPRLPIASRDRARVCFLRDHQIRVLSGGAGPEHHASAELICCRAQSQSARLGARQLPLDCGVCSALSRSRTSREPTSTMEGRDGAPALDGQVNANHGAAMGQNGAHSDEISTTAASMESRFDRGSYESTGSGMVVTKLEEEELETDADSETYHSSDEAIESSLQDVLEDVTLDERGTIEGGDESKPNGEVTVPAKMDLEDYKVNQTLIEAGLGLRVEQLNDITEKGLEVSTTLEEDLMATRAELEHEQPSGPAVAANAGLEAGREANEGLMETEVESAATQNNHSIDERLEAGTKLAASTVALEQAGEARQVEQDQQRVAPEEGSGAAVGAPLQEEGDQQRVSTDERSGAPTASVALVSEQKGEEQRSDSRRPSASGADTFENPQQTTDLTSRRVSEPGLMQTPAETPTLGGTDEHSQEVPAEEADTGRIPFFIITNSGRVRAYRRSLHGRIYQSY